MSVSAYQTKFKDEDGAEFLGCVREQSDKVPTPEMYMFVLFCVLWGWSGEGVERE